jgi:membrane-associated phospholipid phosphatase
MLRNARHDVLCFSIASVFHSVPIRLKKRLATLLSAIFHPLLVPSYLAGLVGLQQVQGGSRLWAVVVFTFLLPTGAALLLLRLGRIDSLEMPRRQQRAWPLGLAALSFGAGAGWLHWQHAAPALVVGLAGMALAVLLTFLITLRWKISAHGVGMGGAAGLLLALHLAHRLGPEWVLGTVVLAAAVGWARLALRAHTPAQVWAGLALGLGVALGSSAVLAVG